MRKFRLILITVVTTAILISCLFAVYFLFTRHNNTTIAVVERTSSAAQTSQAPAKTDGASENPFLPQTDSTSAIEAPVLHALEILWRLFLAVVLSAILAFRPRKDVP